MKKNIFKSFFATKEVLRQLEELMKHWGENASQVIRRCIALAHEKIK